MPVHFVAALTFSSCPAQPRTPTRRAKPKRKAKPKPKKPAAKPKPPRVLTRQVCTILVDRLEAAVGGQIDLHDDYEPCKQLCITGGEYALLLQILLPEEYAAPREGVAATVTAPGSADRIDAYSRRAGAGQSIYAPGDATATGAHAKGLRIVQRANGSGVRVVGWE